MRAIVTPILEFLRGPKQFFIPIYQRRYSWEKKHCQKLWEDIINIGKNDKRKSHFIGSIVYMAPEAQNIGGVPRYLVIDGQQRLTTLSLLLSALSNTIKEEDIGITPIELKNNYLFNEGKKEELRYKQILTQSDKETLIHLLESRELLPQDPSPLLVKNNRFFEKMLKDIVDGANENINLNTVCTGLEKLMIVDIALDRTEDNPQEIFESLNSTGVHLSEADLIRNYMLMKQTPALQDKLYRDHWLPMEQLFHKKDYAKRFDQFMRHYLTLKTGQIPTLSTIYEKFKAYYNNVIEKNSVPLEEFVKEISRYAEHHVKISVPENNEDDPELRECLINLNDLRADVAYPFLLEVYDYYHAGKSEKSDVIQTLRLVESYVFRRIICGLSNKFLNNTFVHILSKLNGELRILNEALASLLKPHQKFPTNFEFKEALSTKGIYIPNKNNSRCKYILHRLENHLRKEPIEVKEYEIEHVMPQKLTKDWQQELGENFSEIHATYLHTIGNLTLTGYNPEYSNRPFKVKRDMHKEGFCHSPLHLNNTLGDAKEWNEAAIIKRAQELVEKACKVWIYPEGDGDVSNIIDEFSIEIPDKSSSAPKKLRVTMPDGEVIEQNKSIDTFHTALLKLIEMLGEDQVIKTDIDGNCVSTEPLRDAVLPVQRGKYFISTNHSTIRKESLLENLADALGVQMDIEVIEK